MQAVIMRNHGGPEVLQAATVDDPRAGRDEVIVELRAASLNRHDALVRAGIGPAYRFDMPLILGSDGAGIRRDTGEDIVILPSMRWGPSELVAGSDFEVLGGPRDGTYAELVVVPSENVFARPRGFSWEEAAALPLAALTAYRALFVVGGLTAGQRVIVLGAGSGVSIAAMQLALRAGASVAATSSSQEKLVRVRELGVDIVANYRESTWVDELGERVGEGADLVLDSVGSTWQDSIRLLKPGGAVISCGGTDGGMAEVDVRALYLQQKRILGTKLGSPNDFRRLLELVSHGAFTPVIDSVRPLSQAREAHEDLEAGGHFGKLVLSVA